MIAEILRDGYDATGRTVFRISKKRFKYFAPNSPMQRHIASPLQVHCRNLQDVRGFLRGCHYVSDQEQFGQYDYWNPPDDFEVRRHGDCDDFSLWVWRQLVDMGYADVRFVVGRSGRLNIGHAWVQYSRDGRAYLLDPLRGYFSPWLPRLATVGYRPEVSVGWDGNRLRYYEHESRTFNPPLYKLPALVAEWLLHWTLTRPRFWFSEFRYLTRRLRRRLSRRGARRPDNLSS